MTLMNKRKITTNKKKTKCIFNFIPKLEELSTKHNYYNYLVNSILIHDEMDIKMLFSLQLN